MHVPANVSAQGNGATVANLAPAGLGRLDWPLVQQALRGAVGEDDYASWLAPLVPHKLEGRTLTLGVPTRFMQDWIANNYRTLVATTVEAQLGCTVDVALTVAPAFASMTAPAPVAAAPPVSVAKAAADEMADEPSSRFDPRYTFDSFVTGKGNEFAFAAAKRVAEDGGFNPLFLHGGVGLGKTHLMHAIGWEITRRKPALRVLYLSSEQFCNRFIRSLQAKDSLAFKQRLQNMDVLMVDDIQFIGGKDRTQEEFFHTFNALVGAGKQVVLTADRSPHELDNIEERLKSRLGSGLTVKVNPPDVETRLAILRSKAEQMDLQLPSDVLDNLAATIASNVRELEGALNRLVAASRLMGNEITLDFAREQLADLYRLHARVVTVDDIQKAVADYFKIRVADMHSPRRARNLARPRQVAMYLCKQLTTRSFPDIGRAFGGKDHTTVMHGVTTIRDLMERDGELAEHVGILTQMLGGQRLG